MSGYCLLALHSRLVGSIKHNQTTWLQVCAGKKNIQQTIVVLVRPQQTRDIETNVGSMLGRRRRRRANIYPTLVPGLAFAGTSARAKIHAHNTRLPHMYKTWTLKMTTLVESSTELDSKIKTLKLIPWRVTGAVLWYMMVVVTVCCPTYGLTHQTRGIHPMLFHCCSSVKDGGPTLKQRWVNASCLLGCDHV